MGLEHDSWVQVAFGIDVASIVAKAKPVVNTMSDDANSAVVKVAPLASSAVAEVKSTVQGGQAVARVAVDKAKTIALSAAGEFRPPSFPLDNGKAFLFQQPEPVDLLGPTRFPGDDRTGDRGSLWWGEALSLLVVLGVIASQSGRWTMDRRGSVTTPRRPGIPAILFLALALTPPARAQVGQLASLQLETLAASAASGCAGTITSDSTYGFLDYPVLAPQISAGVCSQLTSSTVTSQASVASGEVSAIVTISGTGEGFGVGTAEAGYGDSVFLHPIPGYGPGVTFTMAGEYYITISPGSESLASGVVSLSIPLFAQNPGVEFMTPGQYTGLVQTGTMIFHKCPCHYEFSMGAGAYLSADVGTYVSVHDPISIMLPPGWYYTLKSQQAPSSVVAWGYNNDGQLGDGTTAASSTPVPVTGLASPVAIASGQAHSLAATSDGSVWAWGYNGDGELGNGTTTNSSTPVQVNGLTGGIAVAAAQHHSLALRNDGTVWAWGDNSYGQLGNGTTTGSNTPVQVSVLAGVMAIAAGGNHSLAVTSDGTVWAWGDNGDGELGNGTTTNSSTPVQLSGIAGAVGVAAGLYHSLAVLSDGTVWAWGSNDAGQLGVGTTAGNSTPVQVNGVTNAVAVAAGMHYSLAAINDGTVWAWGDNTYGQLGNGTTTNSSTPVQAAGLADAVAVAAGGYHGLAVQSDGTVWAWGYNNDGQLGNGGNTSSSTPVRVSAANGAAVVAAGDYASFISVSPSLSIAMSHTGNFTPGQANADYTVTVSNPAGAAPTSGTVTVTETAPAGMTLVAMKGAGWTCPAGGSTCTRSDVLAGGGSYPAITVTMNVAASATSPQVNFASVSGGGSLTNATGDSTTINTGGASAVLTVAKNHTGNFTQGQQRAAYTVVVSNTGGAGSTSGTVTVTETVPSGLTLVSMAGTGWTCPAGANTCARSDVLAGGGSYPAITVTVNVAATAASPQVNMVTVSGGGSASSGASDSTAIISLCDVNQYGTTNAADVQQLINEALGVVPTVNDLNGDGVVNLVDVQIVINAALNLGCSVDPAKTVRSLPSPPERAPEAR